MKQKFRKPPTMPHWFWYAILDGCWCCKNRNGCNNCRQAKKYRKEFFHKKIKGDNGNNFKCGD